VQTASDSEVVTERLKLLDRLHQQQKQVYIYIVIYDILYILCVQKVSQQ